MLPPILMVATLTCIWMVGGSASAMDPDEPEADDADPTVRSLDDLEVWQAVGLEQGAILGTSVVTDVDLDADGHVDILVGGGIGTLAGEVRSGTVTVFNGPLQEDVFLDSRSATAVLFGESRNDASILCGAGDLDADGFDDLVVGNPWAGHPYGEDRSAGSAYIVRGPVTGTVDLSVEVQTFRGATAGELLGQCAAPGDVDGDGADDIVIAASQYEGAGMRHGSVYLLRGPAEQSSIEDADQILEGEVEDEYIGYGVAAVGDVNGDGTGDYSVTNAVNNTLSSSEDGVSAYLISGYSPGAVHPREVALTVHYDLPWSTRAMVVNRLGDINGDGYDDTGFATTGFARSPVLTVVEGPFTEAASINLSDASAVSFYSSASGPNPWIAFATPLGDWDGSGGGALAIADGAFSTSEGIERAITGCSDPEPVCSQGAIYIIAQPVEPGAHDLASEADRIEGAYAHGFLGGGRFGQTLQGGSDLNEDGFPDLAVGASSASSGSAGAEGSAYVLFGGTSL